MHPKIKKKISRAMWLCKLESLSKHKRATAYVKNRRGDAFLRLDMEPSGEIICYASGCGMRNYASIVIKALEQ